MSIKRFTCGILDNSFLDKNPEREMHCPDFKIRSFRDVVIPSLENGISNDVFHRHWGLFGCRKPCRMRIFVCCFVAFDTIAAHPRPQVYHPV